MYKKYHTMQMLGAKKVELILKLLVIKAFFYLTFA